MMTPLPKNFVMRKIEFGILNTDNRFDRIGKTAPDSQFSDSSRNTNGAGDQDDKKSPDMQFHVVFGVMVQSTPSTGRFSGRRQTRRVDSIISKHLSCQKPHGANPCHDT